MRFFKALFLIVFFVASMMFLVQNNAVLTNEVALRFSVVFQEWKSMPLPLYVLVLASFLVGGLVTLIYFIIETMILSNKARVMANKANNLQQQVQSLDEQLTQERRKNARLEAEKDAPEAIAAPAAQSDSQQDADAKEADETAEASEESNAQDKKA